jgi:molybdopterin synthase catalytic subunit
MANKSLMDLAIEYQTTLEEVFHSDGEIAPQLESSLDLLSIEIKQKTDAVVYFDEKVRKSIEEFERLSKYFKLQEKRAKQRRESYRQYLITALHRMDKLKIETNVSRIGIRTTKRKSIKIINFQQAYDYLKTHLPGAITTEDDDNVRTTRLAKKEMLEHGNPIPGTMIDESTTESLDCAFRGKNV